MTGKRKRHIGLGLAPEINRPVIDFARYRFDEFRILGEVGFARYHIHR